MQISRGWGEGGQTQDILCNNKNNRWNFLAIAKSNGVYKKLKNYNKIGVAQYNTFPKHPTHNQNPYVVLVRPLLLIIGTSSFPPPLPPLDFPNSLLDLGPGIILHSVPVAYRASATTIDRAPKLTQHMPGNLSLLSQRVPSVGLTILFHSTQPSIPVCTRTVSNPSPGK